MERVNCPELCSDCPLAAEVPDPRLLEQSDRWNRAEGQITNDSRGSRASFEFVNGRPTGPHLVEVGLISKNKPFGLGFWVKDSVGLSGVKREIQQCSGPKKVRSGFLKLTKTTVCGAVANFAEEV